MNDIFESVHDVVAAFSDAGFSVKTRKIGEKETVKIIQVKKKGINTTDSEIEGLLFSWPFYQKPTEEVMFPNVNAYRWVYSINDDCRTVSIIGFNFDNTPMLSELPIYFKKHLKSSVGYLLGDDEPRELLELATQAVQTAMVLSNIRVIRMDAFLSYLAFFRKVWQVRDEEYPQIHPVYEEVNALECLRGDIGFFSKEYYLKIGRGMDKLSIFSKFSSMYVD